MCCKNFKNIAKNLGWFTYSNDVFEKILILPYVLGTEPKLKINYCPSCGKKISGIEIEPKEIGL